MGFSSPLGHILISGVGVEFSKITEMLKIRKGPILT